MRSRSRSTSPIGIDFDYNEFRAIQYDRGLQPIAIATIPRTGSRKLMPKSDEIEKLASILAQRGFTGSQVAIAVPKRSSSFHLLTLPPQGSGAPIAKLALIEAQRSGSHKTKDLQIGFWTLPTSEGASKKASPYYTVAAETEPLNEVADCFEDVGLIPISIEPIETALTRSASFHNEFTEKSIHAIVEFGWDCSTVVITLGSTPVYTRRVEFGAARFRRQLIDDHAMPVHAINPLLNPTQVDAALSNDSSFEERRVHRIVASILTPMLTEIADQLDTALTYVSQQHRFAPFGVVFRTGYFSTLEQTAHSIAQRTGMPTLDLEVPVLDDPTTRATTPFESRLSPRLTIAAGLALGAYQHSTNRSLQGAAS
ncbi:MAG: pilus assembly protein PilM [Phycisphaerales bacterium]|nr:pilus assembly protein PilM [Phycisphaerales bacterium]